MNELIRIRNLTTAETNKAPLNNFRLQVFTGEILGLVGLNGSGKSTLADVLSGEVTVKSAQIHLNGKRVDFKAQLIPRILLEKEGVFIVRNENRLIGNLNVSENMSISMKQRLSDLLKNPGRKEKLVELTLAEFFPSLNPDKDAEFLPPAVHWRIGILKAYIEGAKLIILDRIVEFCSETERQQLFYLIELLRKKGTAFVITYNKVAPFLAGFDRTGVVRGGGLAAIIHRSEFDSGLLANLIIGREYTDRSSIRNEDSTVGGRLLEVRDTPASAEYGNISLTLHSAEILGIWDPVQEKSAELIDLLSGRQTAGNQQLLVNGKAVTIKEEHNAVGSGIGIVSEKIFDKLFFRELTAGQNLAISAAKRSAGFAGRIPASAENYLEQKYLQDTGIPESAGSIAVKYLEKDLQFILALHMRILGGARILLLENPVRGADLLSRKNVYHRIELLRSKGTGIIFISTDFTELDGFCDRIIQYDRIGAA